MTEATDQFAELTRRGHELFTAAVQAWDQAARSIAGAARRPEDRLPDIRASVDAAFDFAAQMLADQRDFTKTLMSVGSKVVAATAERAEPVTEPGARTRSDVRSAPDTGTPTAESHPGTTASDGQPGTGETAAAPPKDAVPTPGPDDSAGTETPAPAAAATPAPRKTVAKKTTTKKTTTAKKSAAKKSAAKKSAAPATTPAPAPAAKKTPAPAKRSSPAKRAAGPRDGDTA
jgi:hypothetical protein